VYVSAHRDASPDRLGAARGGGFRQGGVTFRPATRRIDSIRPDATNTSTTADISPSLHDALRVPSSNAAAGEHVAVFAMMAPNRVCASQQA